MSDGNRTKIIGAIFAAYLSNDRQVVEDFLTDDFRFTELEKIFVEGDEAFVTYKCLAKGGRSFRNTEFFSFDGDRVKRIDVYFGATYENGAFVKQPQ
jgi:hypothetical protein